MSQTNQNNQLQKIEFTSDQIGLIRSQIAPKATPDELKLFLYQAQRTGLDPLARQIYAIHRNQKDQQGNWTAKMTIQTSIDGFRVIAERSGVYAGQSEPVFDETNGVLKSCKVAVFKFDPRGARYEAAVGVAYWNEYVQTNQNGQAQGLWAKMPHTMLSKVAEALALRKAFPQDLSGLYTNDEMNQADKTEDATFEVQQPVQQTHTTRGVVTQMAPEQQPQPTPSVEQQIDRNYTSSNEIEL